MNADRLDIASEPTLSGEPLAPPPRRRYLGIHFACCDVYSRVYINQQQTAYVGHCPRCARPVRVGVSPDGTDARFFTAK
jgi:hypothetical protein